VPASSGSSEITIFKAKRGATAAKVLADLGDGFIDYPSIAAKGTRELTRDATGGSDVQSPWTSLQLTYNLSAGTYVLLCFVADDETGMPHAISGMRKVLVLHWGPDGAAGCRCPSPSDAI
jgi:hypothetical protein